MGGKGKGKGASKQKTADYSELTTGLKLRVKADDEQYYPAEVVDVSKNAKKAKTPVKIHWVGYTSASDEWVGADRIRSKALKFVSPTKAPARAYTAEEKEFLQANYPKNLETVQAAWISKVVRNKVTAMSVKKKLEAGVTGDAAIFSLAYNNSYHPSGKGPSSIVLKYAKDVPANRELAQATQMYEKEVMLYSTLHQRIAKCLPIPKVIGTFVDAEKPNEFFCIAMEDLSIDFNPMDQIKGISLEEAIDLAPSVAGFHAEFWGDELLKNPVICGGKEGKCNMWFEAWMDGMLESPHCIDILYKACLTSPNLQKNFDLWATDDSKKMVRLFKKHGKAIMAEFHNILDARPKTLVHGDMRADNLFQRKPELGKGFKFIDWQTFAAAAPGVELVQLFSGSFAKLEDLEHLEPVMEAYLKALHDKCPASKAYTMEMLKEDWTIAFTVFWLAASSPFAPLMEVLPAEHPLWELFSTVFPRYIKMGQVLKNAEYVIKTCERLGLDVDPAVPFLDAEAPDSSHSKAWNLWHKAGNKVLNEVRFRGILDDTKFGAIPATPLGRAHEAGRGLE